MTLLTSSRALSKQAFGQLQSMRDVKKTQLEKYFKARRTEMGALIESVALFGESLQQFTEEYGYEDLYLITRDGTIVYSVAKQADEGQNLLTEPLSDSPLAHRKKNRKKDRKNYKKGDKQE